MKNCLLIILLVFLACENMNPEKLNIKNLIKRDSDGLWVNSSKFFQRPYDGFAYDENYRASFSEGLMNNEEWNFENNGYIKRSIDYDFDTESKISFVKRENFYDKDKDNSIIRTLTYDINGDTMGISNSPKISDDKDNLTIMILKTYEVERGLNNGRFYEKKYDYHYEESEKIGPYLVSFYEYIDCKNSYKQVVYGFDNSDSNCTSQYTEFYKSGNKKRFQTKNSIETKTTLYDESGDKYQYYHKLGKYEETYRMYNHRASLKKGKKRKLQLVSKYFEGEITDTLVYYPCLEQYGEDHCTLLKHVTYVESIESRGSNTCKTCGLTYNFLSYGKYCSQRCCVAYEGMSSKCGDVWNDLN